MNNPVSKFFVAAVFVYVLMISAVWADRVLIDDPSQTVSVSTNFSCYQPAQITVDTVRPELYEQDSTQLQALGDSVRAMLSYECPQLSSIQLTGLIRGLDEVVYQGELSRNNNWLVQQVAAVDSNQYAPVDKKSDTQQARTLKRYDDELGEGQFEVIGLRLGMTVDQVAEIIEQRFDIEPKYNATDGLMSMNAGGCPANFNINHETTQVQPNWKCLKAWFSDNRIARLESLELVQVVEGQPQQVNNLLIDKYGNPTESDDGNNSNKTQHTWRTINSTDNQSSIQELDAVVFANESNLVTTQVSLYSIDDGVKNGNQQYADIDLKL